MEAEEKAKASSPDTDGIRTVNPREPPEKKRIVTDHKEQRQSDSSREIKAQNRPSRSSELKHKSDKYQDLADERQSSKGKSDRTDSRSREGRRKDDRKERTHGHRSDVKKKTSGKRSMQSSGGSSSGSKHERDDSTSDMTHDNEIISGSHSRGENVDEMDVSKSAGMEEEYDSTKNSESMREPQYQIDTSQAMEFKAKQSTESFYQESNLRNYDEIVSVGATQENNQINESGVLGKSAIVTDYNEQVDIAVDVDADVCQAREDVSDQIPADNNRTMQPCDAQDTSEDKVPDMVDEMDTSNLTVVERATEASKLATSEMDTARKEELGDSGDDEKNDAVKEDKMECDEGEESTEVGAESDLKDTEQVEERLKLDSDDQLVNEIPRTSASTINGDELNDSVGKTDTVLDTSEDCRTKTEAVASQPESEIFADMSERTCESDSTEEVQQIGEVHQSEEVMDETVGNVKEEDSVVDEVLADQTVTSADDSAMDRETITTQQTQHETSSKDETMQDKGDAADEDVEEETSSCHQEAVDTELGGGDDGDVDEDSWDAMFDDTGASLKPEEEEEVSNSMYDLEVGSDTLHLLCVHVYTFILPVGLGSGVEYCCRVGESIWTLAARFLQE